MRVVLDSNVLVSASISQSGIPAQIVEAWRLRAFTLLVSNEQLIELRRALSYPRVRRYRILSDVETEEFLGEVQRFASPVIPANRLAVVRDPADNHLLEAAVDGQADYVVSGDRDLLDLGSYEGIEIVTPARFVAILREASRR